MATRRVVCSSPYELTELVLQLTQDRDYKIISQRPGAAVLRKRRPRGLLWLAAIVICPPLLVGWALWWVIRPDGCISATVEVAAAMSASPVGRLSPDGRRMWTAGGWVDIAGSPSTLPDAASPGSRLSDPLDAAAAPISPDGTRYWDGHTWRPVT